MLKVSNPQSNYYQYKENKDSSTVECVLSAWKTVPASISVATRCHCQGGPQMNKFETGLQWSPSDVTSRRSPGLLSRRGVPYLTFPNGGGGTLSDISQGVGYCTMWPIPWCIWCCPLGNRQTDTCENTNFTQRYIRAVKIRNESSSPALNCQSANRMLLWQSRSRSSLLCFSKNKSPN